MQLDVGSEPYQSQQVTQVLLGLDHPCLDGLDLPNFSRLLKSSNYIVWNQNFTTLEPLPCKRYH